MIKTKKNGELIIISGTTCAGKGSVINKLLEKDNNFIEFVTGENGVLSHYTRLGIAGWRLDVVDELPPRFVKKIRKAIKNK